jgi:hypothetical protein
MKLPEMPLSADEKEVILRRGKKQFFRNAIRYGVRTFQIRQVLQAYLHSQISLIDLLKSCLGKKNNL